MKISTRAATAAAMCSLLGFVMLATISLAIEPATGLPGMWDYWSGTVGDAVLLPIIIGGLTAAISRLKAYSANGSRLPVTCVAFIGAALGVVSQATWLLDPTPRLNWMIVQPHTLSLAGWYHLLFLIVVSAILAGATFELLLRARSARNVSIAHSPDAEDARRGIREVFGSSWTILVLGATFLFAATVVADSAPSLETLSSKGTVLGVLTGTAASLVVAAAFLRRDVRILFIPLTIGLVLAAVVTVIVVVPSNHDGISVIILVAAALAGSGVSSALTEIRADPSTAWQVPLLVPPVLVIGAASFSYLLPPWTGIAIVAGGVPLLALVSWWMRHRDPDPDNEYDRVRMVALGASIIVLTLVFGRTVPVREPDANAIAPILAGLFLVVAVRQLVSRAVVASWIPLVEAETAVGTAAPGSPDPTIRSVAVRAWTTGFALGVAAFLALVPLAYAVVATTLDFGSSVPPLGVWVALLALTPALLALGWPVIRSMNPREDFPRDRPPDRRPISRTGQFGALVGLVALASVAIYLAGIAGWQGVYSWAVLLVLIIVSIDTAETVLVCSTFLCMRWPTTLDYSIAALLAISSGLLLYWALLFGGGNTGIVFVFAQFVLCAIARMVLVQLAGGLIFSRGRRVSATIQPAWWNHAQDEFVRMVLVLIVVWFPHFVLTHSTSDNMWLNVLIATVPIVVLASDLFIYASKRNIDHVKEESEIRFGGRFSVEWRTVPDYASILPITVELMASRPRLRASSATERVPDETYFRAFAAHMAFITIIRLALLVSTVVYFVVLLFEALIGKADTMASFGTRTGTPRT